ncbi:hypothetical protein CBR_g423 [Chara braunii]|uniref:Uncharacterized protein n=1 Tax=Chara braunii TaxID=69332 RepID=A0A388JQV5_CHABU|nr:hypothetical protein CBR_g423 [Chara braunii]|eukprot:GBG60092.1 hypothetical protein CBR_g423 [Chara braunii]
MHRKKCGIQMKLKGGGGKGGGGEGERDRVRAWSHRSAFDMYLDLLDISNVLGRRAQQMLEIIWELEVGPAPELDALIDWRQVDDLLNDCYTLLDEGGNLSPGEQWLRLFQP